MIKRSFHKIRRLGRVVKISALLMVLVAGIGAYKAYDYTEHNPRFCVSCHIMHDAWDKWATSEHRKVNCHECHRQSKMESMRQLWLTVTRRPTEVGKHAYVPPDRCSECHRRGDNQWIQVANTAGHDVHAGKEKIPCVRCHSKSIHRFRPPVELCRECHARETIEIAGMGALHCTNCHNFLASQSTLMPTRSDCLWCHEKQLSQKPGAKNGTVIHFHADSPMQYPCGNCHNPHNRLPATGTCKSCHAKAYVGRDKLPERHQDCTSCHKPHTWKISNANICQECHGLSEKLPQAWVHANGHKVLNCQDCHRPHQWRVEKGQLCRECHPRANGIGTNE